MSAMFLNAFFIFTKRGLAQAAMRHGRAGAFTGLGVAGRSEAIHDF